MRYFKAFEIDVAPFITWQLWANSIEELAELGDFEDPLIVAEDSLPVKLFGVYVEKIEGGALVARTEGEMSIFDGLYTDKTMIANTVKTIDAINAGTFGYGGHLFPMYESARLRYMAINLDTSSSDTNFLTASGKEVITILEADLPAFFNAYYKQIQSITNI